MEPNLFLTLMIAFVIIVLAIACLAIGWLITGKTKLEKACGRDPTKKRDGSCNVNYTCELCSTPDEKSKKEDDLAEEEKDLDSETKQEENKKRHS